MRRVSSFVHQGLRRISGSGRSFRDSSPPSDPRRVSSAGLLSSIANEDGASRSQRRTSLFVFDAILRAAESEEGTALPSSPRDPLPSEDIKLDGLTNYHVGQLERIKREVDTHNQTIEQLTYTFYDMRQYDYLKHATDCLDARMQSLRNSRNRLAKFVMFHLQELERIAEARQPRLDRRRGEPRFKGIPSYRQWNHLFSL